MEDFSEEEWFTLDDIVESDSEETLFCISVDSPEKQFLIGENIAVPTHNTEEAKSEDELKGEAAMIIGSIARLGRAAGVHLVIATQRPDAKIISGETKANLGVRINCGRTDSNASSMILGTGEGTRVKSNPRGRLYLRIFGSGNHGQGFFAAPSWIDEWLESKGLNQDGSPLGGKKSKLANLVDMNTFSDTDLDSQEGIDNSKIIEDIKEQEASEDFSQLTSQNYDDDEDENWGFDNEETESTTPETPPDDRPLLTGGNKKPNFARPEDDWDTDLENLIEENNG